MCRPLYTEDIREKHRKRHTACAYYVSGREQLLVPRRSKLPQLTTNASGVPRLAAKHKEIYRFCGLFVRSSSNSASRRCRNGLSGRNSSNNRSA